MKIIITTNYIIFYLYTRMQWYAVCFHTLFLHQNQRYRCSIEVKGTTVIFLLSVDY
jgi:hypothetical protein